jgi:uncharacterized protein (TIGR00730 family)
MSPEQEKTLASIRSVCIYCGSANRVDESFKTIARDVATSLARRRIRIVYGGGRVGLMGLTADTALQAGGEVVGIIPGFIRDYEIQHEGLTKLHVVDSMHTRKRMMVEQSDAFAVLPGGFGTLDETFEILSWKKLGLHNKPVVIYNPDGFWTPLLDLIGHMHKHGFVSQEDTLSFAVATNLDELFTGLATPPGHPSDPSTRWF